MKRTLIVGVIVAVGMTMGAGAAQAEGYGTAGCGLGSMLLGDKPGIMQVFAATTNGSFGSQTFGITFGTSNCADAGASTEGATAFVETNREALAKDIARGSGKTIAALATLSGCGNSSAVGAKLQGNYKTIFPNSHVSDRRVSHRVVSLLASDASLQCKNL